MGSIFLNIKIKKVKVSSFAFALSPPLPVPHCLSPVYPTPFFSSFSPSTLLLLHLFLHLPLSLSPELEVYILDTWVILQSFSFASRPSPHLPPTPVHAAALQARERVGYACIRTCAPLLPVGVLGYPVIPTTWDMWLVGRLGCR